MRAIVYPAAATLTGFSVDSGKPMSVEYTLTSLLNEFAWTDSRWRQDEAWLEAFMRLSGKLSDRRPEGTAIRVTDDDHEKLSLVLKTATFRGDHTVQLLRLAYAVLTAKPATDPPSE